MRILSQTTADSVLKWSTLDAATAVQSDDAVNASFLIGWYWADEGEAVRSRAAFVNLAHSLRARAARQAVRTDKLVDELSAFYAIIYATGINEPLPGLSETKTNVSNALALPLYFWEMNWFASGLPGPQGTAIRQATELMAADIERALEYRSSRWRHERYYLPDYACSKGSVPDFLVWSAINSPKLVKKLDEKGGELNKEGVSAAVDEQWPLVDRDSAEKFIMGLKIDADAREKIVFP